MSNKIVFFLHFHKSGGSSINYLFNHYNKHKPNANGNPWTEAGEIIKFWNYNKEEFNLFKTYLLTKKINFVAFEFNFFKLYDQIDLSNIELIVCIRDPYKRYVSNMLFDNVEKMHSFNNKTIWRIGNKKTNGKYKVNYNKFNYYTKMLNGFGDMPDIEINDKHLEIAKNNLSKFSTIIILEDQETFKLLEKYDIYKMEHKNKNKNKKNIIANFEDFKNLNLYDYQLYEYAIELSKTQLENYINLKS